jgi:dolichol-phosphate mannosyltransferase
MNQAASNLAGHRRKLTSLISLIIPCYNEAEGIADTVNQLLQTLKDDDRQSYEFVFVDDHSTDATPEILVAAAQSNSRVKVVRLGANCGSHVACRAGLAHCRGDVAVFLTADLQEGAELLERVLDEWRKGADVVCTVAESRARGSLMSEAFARLYYFLVSHTQRLQHLEDPRAHPRLMDRKAIDHYCRHAPRKHNLSTWVMQQQFQMAFVRYLPNERQFGRSKWTFAKRVALAVNTLLDLTPVLLTGWLFVGALLAGLGLFVGLAAMTLYLWKASPVGLAALGAIILFVAGLVLMGIGGLGVYVWRIYDGLRHGPEYAVQWTVNIPLSPPDSQPNDANRGSR